MTDSKSSLPALRVIQQISLASLIALLIGGTNALLHPEAPPWEAPERGLWEVFIEEVEGLSGEVCWIDARSPASFQAAHVPGAINLSLDAFSEGVDSVLALCPPESTLIVYCDSLLCGASHEVAELLRKDFGYPNAFVLHGGWEAWTQAQKKTSTDAAVP